MRVAIALARRCFSIFIENFHWIGWIAVVLAWRRAKIFRSRPWRIAATLAVAQVLAVTVLGGATLERYLLPVLPLMYIAFAAAWSALPSLGTRIGQFALVAGLVACLFWNPPYPYPYENNLAHGGLRPAAPAGGRISSSEAIPGQTDHDGLAAVDRAPAAGLRIRRGGGMAVQEMPGSGRPTCARSTRPRWGCSCSSRAIGMPAGTCGARP